MEHMLIITFVFSKSMRKLDFLLDGCDWKWLTHERKGSVLKCQKDKQVKTRHSEPNLELKMTS